MSERKNSERAKGFSLLKIVPSKSRGKLVTVLIPVVFFAVCALLVNLGVLRSHFAGLLVPLCYYIIMAVSLNFTVGILGELSLGHAGFMCIGAYVGGLFTLLTQDSITSAWIRFPIAILLGGLIAALAGFLIGMPILRLRGDYLAIVTLAFGEIVRNLVQNIYLSRDKAGLHFSFTNAIEPERLDPATNVDIMKGPMALNGISPDATLLISVILVVITIIVILNMVDSRAGRAIMSIRDNRIAAESTGINITKYKLIVFSLSAFFAGIAGVLFAHYSTVSPPKFDYNMSILILVFVVLGGVGNIRGSIIATAILYILPEVLRGFQSYRMLIYAIVLIVMMLLNNNERFNAWKKNTTERFTAWRKGLFRKKSGKEAE